MAKYGPWRKLRACNYCNHIPKETGSACGNCGAVDTRVIDPTAAPKQPMGDGPESFFRMLLSGPEALNAYKPGIGRPLWKEVVGRRVSLAVWWKPWTWKKWEWRKKPDEPDNKTVDALLKSMGVE